MYHIYFYLESCQLFVGVGSERIEWTKSRYSAIIASPRPFFGGASVFTKCTLTVKPISRGATL